jgi:hypothetical protein
MELNNTQHKSFLWYLDFEPFTWHTFYGEQCPPFVTEENKEAWRRYLTKVIKKHLKAEVMNTPEFRDIELQIREEKLLRLHWSVMAQMPTGTGRRGSVLEYAYWHSPINGLC